MASAGNASLMTAPLRHTLCDHAAGNYRVLTSGRLRGASPMAAELLTAAAQQEKPQLDEKLYFEVFTPPGKISPKRLQTAR
jgi:hypothetical protein